MLYDTCRRSSLPETAAVSHPELIFPNTLSCRVNTDAPGAGVALDSDWLRAARWRSAMAGMPEALASDGCGDINRTVESSRVRLNACSGGGFSFL